MLSEIAKLFAGTSHVALAGLDRATDEEILGLRSLEFVIVSKDEDFHQRRHRRPIPLGVPGEAGQAGQHQPSDARPVEALDEACLASVGLTQCLNPFVEGVVTVAAFGKRP